MAITNRDLPIGTRLVADYKKQRYVCTVEAGEEGEKLYVLEDGKQFRSPSAAGSAVMGTACNGWRFWSLEGEEPPATEKQEPEKKAKKSGGGKRGKKPFQLIVRHENQEGVAEGYTRWLCHADAEYFEVESTVEQPEVCPNGHRFHEPELTGTAGLPAEGAEVSA